MPRTVNREPTMPSRLATIAPRVGAVALVAALGACQDASRVVAPDLSKVTFTIVGGNGQSAPVNTRLPVALRSRVTTPSGQPVPNFVLNFVVTSGGGSVFGGAEETNSSGYAEEVWTLGPRLGPQTVEARTVNPWSGVAADYGEFTATGLPPHNIPVVITNSIGIAIMNADGSNFHQLTTGGTEVFVDADGSAADLSPDHSAIVFTSTRSGSPQVWRMNADGTHLMQLTSGGHRNWAPQWSADGLFIAYVHEPVTGLPDIFTMFRDGSNNQQITFGRGARYPSWSPDGLKIAFEGGIISADEIYVATLLQEQIPTTDSVVQLTHTTNGIDAVPSWSPDGEHILFAGQRPEGIGLFVMDQDGNNLRAIPNTGDVGFFIRPSWSPDSQLIGCSLGLLNADGTNLVTINGGAEGAFPWR